MENEKTAFGTVLFGGFHKESVYRYIEQLVADFELKQKEFDRAKKALEAELGAANQTIAELSAKAESLSAEKEALETQLEQLQQDAQSEE